MRRDRRTIPGQGFSYVLDCQHPLSQGAMKIQITPDKTVPIPASLEPEAATTLRENMQIAGDTAALIQELGGRSDKIGMDADPIELEGSVRAADEVFQAFAERAKQQFEEAMAEPKPDEPEKRKRGRPRKEPIDVNPPALYQGGVAERISAMLREYNNPLVADAAELRQVTINKLLDLSMCGDPRIEIKATELLGKVSDVGLFTEKTEITVTYNTTADLDRMIKDKVRKMLQANAIDITTIALDIESEMGFDQPELHAEPDLIAKPAEEQPEKTDEA